MKKHLTHIRLKQTASCISLFLACWMLLSPCIATVYAADDPSIDWTKIPSHNGTGMVYTWSVAKGEGGYYFYVVGNQNTLGTIDVAGGDGSSYSLIFWPYEGKLQFGWGNTKVEGATITREFIDNNAHFEAFIPEKAFPEEGFRLQCGETVLSENIPNIADIPGAGGGVDPKPTQPPATEPSGSETGDTETGGSETGGSETGGSETGGSETGGSETGGSETGGSETGGSETGGSETGGSETGGSETGGSETGGSETGGSETGGSETGGSESGGTETGGSESSGSDPSIKPTQAPETPQIPAGYNGIVIDGKFDDWAAVSKTDILDVTNEGNPKGYSTVEHMAMVWDGDYVYLYLAADGGADGCGNWDSVTGAGPNGNGQYAITTDLGYQLLVRPKNANGTPAVYGIDGATVAVSNKNYWKGAPYCWEIAIPSSALPPYQKTISFGLYTCKPVISDVANLRGGESGGKFNGIEIDGRYDDWTYYPHETIQYATSGTDENVVDSCGAVYCKDGILYAHAKTSMPAHLWEKGGEFTENVLIKINNTEKLEFSPRFIAVNSNGDINWNPKLKGLAPGKYEFYIASTDAPHTTKNIYDPNPTPGDEIYGRVIITVGNSQDQCEWEMDLAKLADHLRPGAQGTDIIHYNPDNIKAISVKWGRLGNQWVTTTGTSTGPLVGILLCLCAVAVPTVLNRRKRKAICGISFASFS